MRREEDMVDRRRMREEEREDLINNESIREVTATSVSWISWIPNESSLIRAHGSSTISSLGLSNNGGGERTSSSDVSTIVRFSDTSLLILWTIDTTS
jgi:hypothetical protein